MVGGVVTTGGVLGGGVTVGASGWPVPVVLLGGSGGGGLVEPGSGPVGPVPGALLIRRCYLLFLPLLFCCSLKRELWNFNHLSADLVFAFLRARSAGTRHTLFNQRENST